MRANRGVLTAALRLLSAVLITTSFVGCGSDDSSGGTSYPQLPPGGANLYRTGDQVRASVRQDTNGQVQQFESITQVVNVSSDGFSFLIEKLRVQGTRATRESSAWTSANELAPLAIRDQGALASTCQSFGGRILSLTVGSQALTACRVVSNRAVNGVPGSGETWYGALPFGMLKYRWVSSDRAKRIDYEVTSYVRDGSQFVF